MDAAKCALFLLRLGCTRLEGASSVAIAPLAALVRNQLCLSLSFQLLTPHPASRGQKLLSLHFEPETLAELLASHQVKEVTFLLMVSS